MYEAYDTLSFLGVVVSGRFGALLPEGHRFESHSSHHIGTLGKYLTRSYL